MARKSLLTESEIRRFMKLASMRPIGDNRLSKLHEQPTEEELPGEEIPPEGDLPPGPEELEPGLEDPELEAEEEEVDPEVEARFTEFMKDMEVSAKEHLGVDMSVEGAEEMPEEGELGLDEPGLEVDEPGLEPEEPGVPGLDEPEAPGMRPYQEAVAASALDVPAMAGDLSAEQAALVKAECGGLSGAELEECKQSILSGGGGVGRSLSRSRRSMTPTGGVGTMTEEGIVNEVAKRVAARLERETKRDQVADQLAERILKRLTK